jgi:hypothetical protein
MKMKIRYVKKQDDVIKVRTNLFYFEVNEEEIGYMYYYPNESVVKFIFGLGLCEYDAKRLIKKILDAANK